MSADQIHKTQGRLLILAALFLGLFSLALTISPAIRARSWDVDYRWSHWLGVAVWLVGFGFIHLQTRGWLPQRDPILIPLFSMLSGWGLLTIWRLTTYYGMRQTLWLALALVIFALGLRLPTDLYFLRRYKYLWLTGGLIITALTLLFGANPMGYGPRLWLGCCGLYMQPSEPLKLLLIIFLAAYFANWQSVLIKSSKAQIISEKPQSPSSSHNHTTTISDSLPTASRLQILIPTLFMTGIAMLLLIAQRDLGTASLFIFIYAVMVFLATGWRWIPVITALVLAAAGTLGYLLFDVVQVRIEAWINPWLDPTGNSYQIVQSLMAIANGDVFGRGPGMGSPSLVPVAHSDFIFSAIAEENGLIGMIGLLVLLGLLVHRGLLITIRTTNTFRQLLAAGLTVFLVGQSVLIIGGNLRLLPLTGVTLPFVSYGGSSLLISFLVGLLLLLISADAAERRLQTVTASYPLSAVTHSITPVLIFLLITLLAAALISGWWSYVRGPDLLSRTDNPRRALDDRYVYRGALLARSDTVLAETTGIPGELSRSYRYPDLGPVTGYNHPVYGQSGLEASLDPTLRGLEGNDPAQVGWYHLLYGQSPPGLDIRLTLNMSLQKLADDLLDGHSGALIMLNAQSGEILAMSSKPSFDPNQLDDTWEQLVQDPQAPLINRTTQGRYPTGGLSQLPFMQAAAGSDVARPVIRLPLAATNLPEEATPLDVAFAAASLSNAGVRPIARLALSYQHPELGWQLFPPVGKAVNLLLPENADTLNATLQYPDLPIWRITSIPNDEDLTWYLAGTQTGENPPLTLVLVLEEENLPLAEEIGKAVLLAGMGR